MKKFNITAQVYNKFDKYKQTILFNDIVHSHSPEEAVNLFTNSFIPDHKILKIYSVEEVHEN